MFDKYGRAVKPSRVYQARPSYQSYIQGQDLGNILYDRLSVFLSHLKHDLSPWYFDLRDKGLGTMEQLFIISSWEEDRLDRIFAELFPTMPEMYRYALVEGIVGLAQYRKI